MRPQPSNKPLENDAARAGLELPGRVNVPLFRTVIDQLADERRWVVLNLGAAFPQTINLLRPYRCRLDIANLAEEIDTVKPLLESEDSDGLASCIEQLLPDHPCEPTDVVFCWDFLNYMESSVMTQLMAAIAERCRPGALLHALIAYSQPLMQEQPGQFAPVDEGQLVCLSDAKPSRIAPRYSTEDLRRCMPGFSVDRVRLLGNGMQEYLFVR